jgi:glutamate N-acetyltransferase/amino-acid N-acetyltransferase
MEQITGGVTAPKGYTASGVACGLKKNHKKDLAVLLSEYPAAVAGMYTKNVIKGHSLKLTMENAKNGFASAVIINSGNANACVGEQGDKDAREMADLTAKLLGCSSDEVLVGSTGVIGIPLRMPLIREGIRSACDSLSSDGGEIAAEAITTTDKQIKQYAIELELQEQKVRIGGMAKGSGMIHPNMATMICILTTDVNIKQSLLKKALLEVVEPTFNRISVDGETSVCDMVLILANGFADNEGITKESYEYDLFKEALLHVCEHLAKSVVQDGEGATRIIDITVKGANTAKDAYSVASRVACSPLVKTAINGADANWGRLLTAVGYSDATFEPGLVDISIGNIMCCKNGSAVKFDEAAAKQILEQKEIKVVIDLKCGNFADHYMTCDFSVEYVKINSNYRS